MKPTKTQLEITKLEKQIAKLHGDLAQKRRLEALRAEADALREAIKAAPCDKPHYPAPCPLPHSPWMVGPWNWAHHTFCRCSQCHPPHGWLTTTNPIITCTDGLGSVTTTPNTGKPYTVYGGGLSSGNGTVSVFSANSSLATGTQASVASTPTFAIGESEN